MATALYTRPGDAQALKACIAAACSGSQLRVIGDQEVPASPFGARGIAAVVDGGDTLTEPNAIAWMLAGALWDCSGCVWALLLNRFSLAFACMS